jgi:hypothetical protein
MGKRGVEELVLCPRYHEFRYLSDELLHGAEVKMPPQFGTFKQAQRVQQTDHEQAELELFTG